MTTIKRFYLLLLPCIICILASKQSEASYVWQSTSISDTSYRIIHSELNTYGYEILINGKVLIRQKNIPGLPGNKGFVKKSDAIKTATLVIEKLRQGIMPPTITANDLSKLEIIALSTDCHEK